MSDAAWKQFYRWWLGIAAWFVVLATGLELSGRDPERAVTVAGLVIFVPLVLAGLVVAWTLIVRLLGVLLGRLGGTR